MLIRLRHNILLKSKILEIRHKMFLEVKIHTKGIYKITRRTVIII